MRKSVIIRKHWEIFKLDEGDRRVGVREGDVMTERFEDAPRFEDGGKSHKPRRQEASGGWTGKGMEHCPQEGTWPRLQDF